MNLIDVTRRFGNPEAANDLLEKMRWPDGPECLYCGDKRVTKYVKQPGTRTRINPKTGATELKPVPTRILYVCRACKKQFSVKEGTIFNDTHLTLDKWFAAVALMVNAKKGLSARQLERDLDVAHKTAWYLNHRIRKAMGLVEAATDEPLTGSVEVDETYIGGKYDKRRKRARWDKKPVVGTATSIPAPVQESFLEGLLEAVEGKVRITPAAGPPSTLSYDADKFENILIALHKPVRVRVDPKAPRKIVDIEVTEIPTLLDTAGFFHSRSIDQLIAEQHIQPIADITVLSGAIPDEDVDEFVADIYRDRRR